MDDISTIYDISNAGILYSFADIKLRRRKQILLHTSLKAHKNDTTPCPTPKHT